MPTAVCGSRDGEDFTRVEERRGDGGDRTLATLRPTLACPSSVRPWRSPLGCSSGLTRDLGDGEVPLRVEVCRCDEVLLPDWPSSCLCTVRLNWSVFLSSTAGRVFGLDGRRAIPGCTDEQFPPRGRAKNLSGLAVLGGRCAPVRTVDCG